MDKINYPSIVDGMLVHWWANGQTIQAPHVVSCATWRRTLGVALTTLDGGRRGWRVEQVVSCHWRTEADDVAIGIDDRALVLTPTRCRPACGKRLRIRACDFRTSTMK